MRKITLRQKQGFNILMDKLRFDDQAELGGQSEPGMCRGCGKEVLDTHPGRLCPRIKRIDFFQDGGVRAITMKGGGREDGDAVHLKE